eukprot:TRINITY_DN903_c0_g1_i10.p1 TRINITY_DN903_c0_g1~~TRINITY_DN903_c0_g1_i10.p1  ORF type:complete len:571 (-),score=233.47 TRINITY_DN903_c0_g1_i10:97-1809(-)
MKLKALLIFFFFSLIFLNFNKINCICQTNVCIQNVNSDSFSCSTKFENKQLHFFTLNNFKVLEFNFENNLSTFEQFQFEFFTNLSQIITLKFGYFCECENIWKFSNQLLIENNSQKFDLNLKQFNKDDQLKNLILNELKNSKINNNNNNNNNNRENEFNSKLILVITNDNNNNDNSLNEKKENIINFQMKNIKLCSSVPSNFVSVQNTHFQLNGCPFYFAGTNTYYLGYNSNYMVDDLFANAVSMGLKVVRTWAFIDIGGSGVYNVDGPKNGIYYQSWGGSKPIYNDGSTGLENLDYVVYSASKHGLKLILTLVNNWNDFGGMDQYNAWYGLTYHSDFYTNSNTKQAYKNWISHLVNRKNTKSGTIYRDDATILAWELANEPRCEGSKGGRSPSCTSATICNWISEMSSYLRSIDSYHMIAVGDEGFFSGYGNDWTENGSEGDFDCYISQSQISFGTFHLYPDSWSKSNDWGNQWIQQHISSANSHSKPVLLEEFGIRDQSQRAYVYQNWLSIIQNENAAASTYWMLAAHQDNGSLYPDYDGYTVYNDNSDAANQIRKHAANMTSKSICH